jgi:hypothetical protein
MAHKIYQKKESFRCSSDLERKPTTRKAIENGMTQTGRKTIVNLKCQQFSYNLFLSLLGTSFAQDSLQADLWRARPLRVLLGANTLRSGGSHFDRLPAARCERPDSDGR